jgi:predicted dehydrogenase
LGQKRVKRVLVVGCGSIGLRHAVNAARTAAVSVADIDHARAASVAREIGVSVCDTVEQGLKAAPDAVVIAVPHQHHLPLASAALQATANLMIEKPLAAGLAGVADFLRQVEHSGRRVRVVCNMRFHPAIAALRRALPMIGRPQFAQAHYGNYLPDMRPGADYRSLYCAKAETGGGVILDAIHEIDYLVWLFGAVQRVTAEAGKLSDLDIDVEDYASIVLTHAGGVRSEIHLDYLQRFKRRGCVIAGSEGTLVWTSEGKSPERCLVRFRAAGASEWQVILDQPALDTAAPYVELMQRFLDPQTGDQDLLDARGGAECLAIALAAKQSAATLRAATPEPIG